ncbi:MAG: type 4a pilus biogenesis protein PilO [SAR324 cluster bacterium]|nr:type 4a pilus biogenesis protein PilO [SAR324 cluster bacterium]
MSKIPKSRIFHDVSNQHWLLILLMGIFLSLLFYNLELNPVLSRQDKLERRFHKISTELKALKQYQLYQSQFEEQTIQMEEKIFIMDQAIPLKWEIGKITSHLFDTIRKSQLQLMRQVVAPETQFEHYVELVIHLELEGYYHQLLEFVNQVEILPFLVNIRKLDIVNRRLSSQDPRLQIQMDLSVYRRQSD